MHDAMFVGRVERVGDLPRDRHRFGNGQRALAMRSASVGPSISSMTSAVVGGRAGSAAAPLVSMP